MRLVVRCSSGQISRTLSGSMAFHSLHVLFAVNNVIIRFAQLAVFIKQHLRQHIPPQRRSVFKLALDFCAIVVKLCRPPQFQSGEVFFRADTRTLPASLPLASALGPRVWALEVSSPWFRAAVSELWPSASDLPMRAFGLRPSVLGLLTAASSLRPWVCCLWHCIWLRP